MLPNANGAAVATLALMSAGRVPAMINFSAGIAGVRAACRAAKIALIVTSRVFVEKARLEALVGGLSAEVQLHFSRGRTRTDLHHRQTARLARRESATRRTPTRRSRRNPVHLRIRGHAERRRPVPSQHAGQRRASRGSHRFRPPRQSVQRAAAIPFLWPDRWAHPTAGVRRARSTSILPRCITGSCRR